MKSLTYLCAFGGLWAASCGTPSPTFNTYVSILIDRTDPITARPTAQSIVSGVGLNTNPAMGLQIRIGYISDKDINSTVVLTLDSESFFTGNATIRAAQVRRFVITVQRTLDSMNTAGTCAHSIIYRTVATQANYLSHLHAGRKYLIVLSDLLEHSTLSFYDPATLRMLKTHPYTIAQQFEHDEQLANLTGVDMWFLYDPSSYANNASFMSVATFFKSVFEKHGAVIHLDKQFMP